MPHLLKYPNIETRNADNARRILVLEKKLNLERGANNDLDVKSHESRLEKIEKKLGLKNRGGIPERNVDLRSRRNTSRVQMAENRGLDAKAKTLTASAKEELERIKELKIGGHRRGAALVDEENDDPAVRSTVLSEK